MYARNAWGYTCFSWDYSHNSMLYRNRKVFFSKYVLSFLRKMPAVFKDGEKKYIVLCKFLSSLFFMYKLFIWSLLLEQKCFENVPSR